MLEVLLNEYEARWGEKFPLELFTDTSEIAVINILYKCLEDNIKYEKGMSIPENAFPEAPGLAR